MARIKVTGYLNTDDMDVDHVDPNHDTGMTEKGQDAVYGYSGIPYKLADLEDLELELEP